MTPVPALLQCLMVKRTNSVMVAFVGLMLGTLSLCFAQDFTQDIEVRLGFAESVVSGAWNPLTVRLRDQPPSRLVIAIDQGSLRDGEQWITYEVPLTGGRGLTFHRDDVYVPARWQQFVWSVRTPETVLASGSFDRRQLDVRPLQLVVAREMGAARAWFARDERVVDVLASNLPERAAAYDGIETIILVEANSQLRVAALAAAATAGVTVVLAEPISETLGMLEPLAPTPVTALGSGVVVRTDEATWPRVRQAVTPISHDALAEALLTGMAETPAHPLNQNMVVVLASLYAALTLMLLAWGGIPGLLSSGLLALALSLAGWLYLRPDDNVLVRARQLVLGASELAYVIERQRVFSFPEQVLELDQPAHALEQPTWQVSSQGMNLTMPRWSQDALALKPRLQPATFVWQDGALINRSEVTLTDVFVFNFGRQPDMAAASRRIVALDASARVPTMYEPLAPYLPAGSALARRGNTIYVALPEPTGLPVLQSAQVSADGGLLEGLLGDSLEDSLEDSLGDLP